MGQESPACHDFGWFCQGNHIISRANSWKTSHVNQHWHWLGALKNDTWGWFDNNFILGVGKEDFSIVGRRLLKLWVLVVSQCRCFGVFYWCIWQGALWVTVGFDAQIPPLPKNHYRKIAKTKNTNFLQGKAFDGKPWKSPRDSRQTMMVSDATLKPCIFQMQQATKTGVGKWKRRGGGYFFFFPLGAAFLHTGMSLCCPISFFSSTPTPQRTRRGKSPPKPTWPSCKSTTGEHIGGPCNHLAGFGNFFPIILVLCDAFWGVTWAVGANFSEAGSDAFNWLRSFAASQCPLLANPICSRHQLSWKNECNGVTCHRQIK